MVTSSSAMEQMQFSGDHVYRQNISQHNIYIDAAHGKGNLPQRLPTFPRSEFPPPAGPPVPRGVRYCWAGGSPLTTC
jgi:hypothetical protein